MAVHTWARFLTLILGMFLLALSESIGGEADAQKVDDSQIGVTDVTLQTNRRFTFLANNNTTLGEAMNDLIDKQGLLLNHIEFDDRLPLRPMKKSIVAADYWTTIKTLAESNSLNLLRSEGFGLNNLGGESISHALPVGPFLIKISTCSYQDKKNGLEHWLKIKPNGIYQETYQDFRVTNVRFVLQNSNQVNLKGITTIPDEGGYMQWEGKLPLNAKDLKVKEVKGTIQALVATRRWKVRIAAGKTLSLGRFGNIKSGQWQSVKQYKIGSWTINQRGERDRVILLPIDIHGNKTKTAVPDNIDIELFSDAQWKDLCQSMAGKVLLKLKNRDGYFSPNGRKVYWDLYGSDNQKNKVKHFAFSPIGIETFDRKKLNEIVVGFDLFAYTPYQADFTFDQKIVVEDIE